ncbi:MAG: EutN/CcmL family microcompartment protein [Bacteroidota bacterium]
MDDCTYVHLDTYTPHAYPLPIMLLCRVTGTVVSTQKSISLCPSTLLVVRRVDTEGVLVGTAEWLALDPGFDAGVGDAVIVAREGAVVAQLMGDNSSGSVPANVIVIGVVDDWSVIGGTV